MDRFSVCWLRCGDLRIDDNPALLAASEAQAVVIVFTWCPKEDGEWGHEGTALQLFIAEALKALDRDLYARYKARICMFNGVTR